MKKKLIVLYEEDKLNPKNTWSGTCYQLKEALKDYLDVVFIDAYDIKPIKLIKILSKKIEKHTTSYVVKPIYEKLHEIEINNRIKKYKDVPVLEICENVILKNDFYLYRDMAYACYKDVYEELKNDNNDYGHGMLNFISKKALKKRIIREEKIQHLAKGTFFMGKWLKDLMSKYYPNEKDKFIHAGGGLNKELKISDIKKDLNLNSILFVGIDFKRKGGELLLKAFDILNKEYNDNAKLYIAGPNIKKEENNICYVGKASREELSTLFNKCNIFCMPSRFEAYGLVFIEAMCYGMPIVSYNRYEMPHFIQNEVNGYLIDNYDENDLALALHKALNNKVMQELAIKNAKANQDKYSWNKVAERIYNYIERFN